MRVYQLVVCLALIVTEQWFAAKCSRCWPSEPLQYNSDILPILVENCFTCHGPDKAARQANLRLDRVEDATARGDGPTAIVPGRADQSELVRRIATSDHSLLMPPPESGKQLTPLQVAQLQRWINDGAHYQPHWSLVPLPPQAELLHQVDWSQLAQSPIDHFIQRSLPDSLTLNPPADRWSLVRRLSLDLTGLPPTHQEAQQFVADSRPDSVHRLVDRLLASPKFGERWARWWLDLAHYADSDGYLQDFLRPHAWRFRDWVVDAFNSDMPFDQFTIAQLAGDLIADRAPAHWSESQRNQQRIATGFLRQTLSNREGGADLEEYRVRQVVDRTVTVSTTWLGLTIGCAECHDHKYDPLSQIDFYRLYAYFNDCDEVNVDDPLPEEQTVYTRAWTDYLHARTRAIGNKAEEIARLQKAWEDQLLWTEQHPGVDHRWDRLLEVLGLIWGQGQGEGQLEGLNIVKTPSSERTPAERSRLENYFLQHGSLIDPPGFESLQLSALASQLGQMEAQLPKVSRPQTITTARRPRTTHLHQRGDFRRPANTVTPGVPAIFQDAQKAACDDRVALATWIVSDTNPLTARVLVNRLWQELFGRGLVNTSDNLGVRGDKPTHPELLDWLAGESMRCQWDCKQLMRVIVLSDAYQRSSHWSEDHRRLDPQNHFFARQSRWRVSSEAIRDSVLRCGGLLDERLGGPSVRPPQPESVASEGFDNKWPVSEGGQRYRRGLYTFWQRTSPFAQSVTFDMPDSSRSCTWRERSNTPLQALTLLNDPVLLEGSVGAAYLTLSLTERADDEERAVDLFRIIVGRPPSDQEVQRVVAYVQQQVARFRLNPEAAAQLIAHRPETLPTASSVAEWAGWSLAASVLLNLDESLTRP